MSSKIIHGGNRIRRVRHRYMPTMLFKKHQRDWEGPMCLTCLKPVEEEELVEGYAKTRDGNPDRDGTGGGQYPYAKVLYRCHGAEELVQYDFDTCDWDDRDLRRMAQRHRHFDPMGHKDEGKLIVQV